MAAEVLGRPVTSDVGWLAGGALDPMALAEQHRVGVRAEIVDGALAPRPAGSFTPNAHTTLPVPGAAMAGLVTDPGLSRLASLAAADASPAIAVQRFLAETAMIVAESPGRARTVLVAPPREWDPDTDALTGVLYADAEAPWTVPVGLAELRAIKPTAVGRAQSGRNGSSNGDNGTAPRSLPGPYLQENARLRERAELAAGLLGDPLPARRAAQDVALRLACVAWVDRPARAEVVAGVRGALEALEGRVRIVPGGVTFGGRSGVLPITVVNDLDAEVAVRVELRASSGKLEITPSVPIIVAPRSSGQVVFPTEARATGIVYVDAQLVTVTGERYGPSVRKRVTVTQYGTVGLLVTVGAAVVLFGAATLRVVRRARTAGGRGGARSGRASVSRAQPTAEAPTAEAPAADAPDPGARTRRRRAVEHR